MEWVTVQISSNSWIHNTFLMLDFIPGEECWSQWVISREGRLFISISNLYWPTDNCMLHTVPGAVERRAAAWGLGWCKSVQVRDVEQKMRLAWKTEGRLWKGCVCETKDCDFLGQTKYCPGVSYIGRCVLLNDIRTDEENKDDLTFLLWRLSSSSAQNFNWEGGGGRVGWALFVVKTPEAGNGSDVGLEKIRPETHHRN